MELSWIDVEQLRRHWLDCSTILSEGKKRKQQESGTVSALQGGEKGTGATITRDPQGQCSVPPGNRVRKGTKKAVAHSTSLRTPGAGSSAKPRYPSVIRRRKRLALSFFLCSKSNHFLGNSNINPTRSAKRCVEELLTRQGVLFSLQIVANRCKSLQIVAPGVIHCTGCVSVANNQSNKPGRISQVRPISRPSAPCSRVLTAAGMHS